MEEIPFPQGSITALPFLGEHGDLTFLRNLFTSQDGQAQAPVRRRFLHVSPEVYRRPDDVGDVDACLWNGMRWCTDVVDLWSIAYAQSLSAKRSPRAWLVPTTNELSLSSSSFAAKKVYVYALGQEPWLNYIMSNQIHGRV